MTIFEFLFQGLFQWLYGLMLDLFAYSGTALLKIMSTDLSYFETNVPVVITLYQVFVAIGWGLLIGNCAFQSLKAMFAGLGFETESPAALLFRTAIFGTLLIFSKDICEIGLSIGNKAINLIGMPNMLSVTIPNESWFSGVSVSWLLTIIIGVVICFQLFKLFFEIAERYAVVAILTLLCPVALAFGGSKSTKDICSGFMRTYASMIVMLVMNVLFLKLIISALSTIPPGYMVIPWTLLIVGIVRTSRKIDQIIGKIGLSPAITGDPLGTGRGMLSALIAARTIMMLAGKGGSGKTTNTKAKGNINKNSSNTHNAKGGTNVNGGKTNINGANTNNANSRNNQSANQSANHQNNGSINVNSRTGGNVSNGSFRSSGGASINSNRFGSSTGSVHSSTNSSSVRQTPKSNQNVSKNVNGVTNNGKGNSSNTTNNAYGKKGVKNNTIKHNTNNAPQKNRFGSNNFGGGIKHNKNPLGVPKSNIGKDKSIPDVIYDNVKESLKDNADIINTGGDNDG